MLTFFLKSTTRGDNMLRDMDSFARTFAKVNNGRLRTPTQTSASQLQPLATSN
jgi:hypothetical protein